MSLTNTDSRRYTAVPQDPPFGPTVMVPTWALNPGRLGAAAQRSSFPSWSESQIVHHMPSACDSTNCAMFVRTSDRGEPANIDFSRLRTDSMENKPDSFSAGPPRDSTSAGDSRALSMNCPSRPCEIRLLLTCCPHSGDVDEVNAKLDDLLPFVQGV